MLKVIYELPCSIFSSDSMITIMGKDKNNPRNYIYVERPYDSEYCEVHSVAAEQICKRAGSRILWAVWED